MKTPALFFLLFSVLLSFCGSSDHPAVQVTRDNIRYAGEENIEAYMNTLHEESPVYAGTQRSLANLFNNYDLKYEVEEAYVLTETDTLVEVQYVQVTRNPGDGQFRDNRLEAVNTLKKSGDVWKIYSTRILHVSYLDKEE